MAEQGSEVTSVVEKPSGGSGSGSYGSNTEPISTQAQLDAVLRVFDSQRNQNSNGQIRATMANVGIGGKNQVWIIDSGATNHMTSNKCFLDCFKSFTSPKKVRIANGDNIDILGYGNIRLSDKLHLKYVLYVPNLDCNLISVKQLMCDNNCWTVFTPNQCFFIPSSSSCFQEKALKERITKGMIGNADHQKGLYFFNTTRPRYSSVYSYGNKSSVVRNDKSRIDLILLWHRRLGHPNFSYLKRFKPHLFNDISVNSLSCETCLFGKQSRAQYPAKGYEESKPFNLVHSDIWGPSRVLNVNGSRWFVIFVDDHTQVTWTYLMKHKSELSHVFKMFISLVQNQFNTSIKNFRSDNGSEYLDKEVRSILVEKGIHHQTSNVYTPQQNGVAERKHRHILDVARSLMFSMNVQKYLWGEAVLTATYLINRMPSRVLDFASPRDKLLSVFPHCLLLSELPFKTFGCVAYVYIQSQFRSKLDKRSIKCIFLGYSGSQKGYKCLCPNTRKMYTTLDVVFDENMPYYSSSLSSKMDIQQDNYWCIIDVATTGSKVNNSSAESWTSEGNINNISPEEPQEADQERNSLPIPITQVNSRRNDQVQQPNFSSEILHHSDSSLENEQESNLNMSHESDLPIAVRKGTRECTKYHKFLSNKGYSSIDPLEKVISYDRLGPNFKLFTASLDTVTIPTTIEEALGHPGWKQAVTEEMSALVKNNTWSLVTKPEHIIPIGCKWVFTLKYNSDGTLNRYKARLVAKGFTQSYGIDYVETFAPVAKLNTIRIIFSLAVNLDWKLIQLDIKNAFLNGKLKEQVFMDIPPGFESSQTVGKICKLNRSIYGLKQSPRAWFNRFTEVLLLYGFKQAQSDHTLFVYISGTVVIVLIVYVDDIILTGNCHLGINKVKSYLATEFEVKDLGSLRYFLGMEVGRSETGMVISQRKYILDLLQETGMLGCKPVSTPLEHGITTKDHSNEAVLSDIHSYQKLVGKLIYLSHTRPDICFAVSYVNQFMHSPTNFHLQVVMRILRYLKGAPGQGLFFGRHDCRDIKVYTDADWGGSKRDMRSTSGYCTYLWGNLITWRSKKQTVVARSSAEAELRALALGVCEGLWIKRVLKDLQQLDSSLQINAFCDNISAIHMAENPVHHDKTKHVEIDRHFIREKLEDLTLSIQHISSSEQVADILTKSLSPGIFHKLLSKLGCSNVYTKLEGGC